MSGEEFDPTEDATVDPKLLTPGDLHSATWKKLARHLQERQQVLRARNDNPKLDPLATAALRGELRVIRNLLALGNQTRRVVADEELPE